MNCPKCGQPAEQGNYTNETTSDRDGVLPKPRNILGSCICHICYKRDCAYLFMGDGSIWWFVFGSDKGWQKLIQKVPSAKHIGGFKVIQY